jgi:hypothetical protein
MKLIYQFLFIVVEKNIVFYSRIMAITRSDELRHSPAARDTKSSCFFFFFFFTFSAPVGGIVDNRLS